MKRKITPHKGGRDKQLAFDVTVAERELVNSEAKKHGKSQADFILWCIEQTLKQEEQSE